MCARSVLTGREVGNAIRELFLKAGCDSDDAVIVTGMNDLRSGGDVSPTFLPALAGPGQELGGAPSTPFRDRREDSRQARLENSRISLLTDNRVFGELLAAHIGATLRVGLADQHWIDHALAPDLVLLDGSLNPELPLVQRGVRRCKVQRLTIVVVACPNEPLVAARWIDLGADALSYVDATMKELESTLAGVVRGESALGVGVRELLLSELRAERAGQRDREVLFEKLTKREMQVLCLLAQATTPEEIARQGFVSLNTVRTQIRSILAKLTTTSVVGAVALAYRTGWIAHVETAGQSSKAD